MARSGVVTIARYTGEMDGVKSTTTVKILIAAVALKEGFRWLDKVLNVFPDTHM